MVQEEGPDSPPSSTVVLITLFEEFLKRSVYTGVCFMVASGTLFLLYVILGIAGAVLGWFDPPYTFLSLESDPLFNIGGTLAGISIVQSSGSLLLYYFLVGVEDSKSELAMLFAFVCFGFGGALLRVTFPRTLQIITRFL